MAESSGILLSARVVDLNLGTREMTFTVSLRDVSLTGPDFSELKTHSEIKEKMAD